MKTLSLKEKIIVITYTAIMFLLYIGFLIIDFSNVEALSISTGLKYSSIILSFLLTLYLFIDGLIKKKDTIIKGFGLLAIILTLISDLFLLVLNDYYITGVITFAFAQMATGARIHFTSQNKKLIIIDIAMRAFALIDVIVLYSFLHENPDSLLIFLAAFYFFNLIMNFVISLVNSIIISRINWILLTIGLSLFIMCDIFVGLANIRYEPTYNGIAWIFYLPCQYLIAISLKNNS